MTSYIDAMLGTLAVLGGDDGGNAGSTDGGGEGAPVPAIFAGGPWSNRHAAGPDFMESFIPPDPVSRIAWRKRLTDWQRQYTQGIALLDKLAGGDFTTADPAGQDEILARSEASTFLSLLFEHTIEGLYSNPEYGGNRDRAGWRDIGFPGDSQPLGYTSAEVERSDGRDPVGDDRVVLDVLHYLEAL